MENIMNVKSQIKKEIELLISAATPEVQGWTREITIGGVLSFANISWERVYLDYKKVVVCFVRYEKGNVQFDYQGHVSKFDPDDNKYYLLEGGFVPTMNKFSAVNLVLDGLIIDDQMED